MVIGYLRQEVPETAERFADLDRMLTCIAELQIQTSESVIHLLSRAGVPTLLLKGADLHLNVYPSHLAFPRMMVDVDLLIHPNRIPEARSVIAAQGFQHGYIDTENAVILPPPERVLRAQEDSPHYELPAYRKVMSAPMPVPFDRVAKYLRENPLPVIHRKPRSFSVPVSLDVHHNIEVSNEVDDLWEHTRVIRLPSGTRTGAQSFADMLWFLAGRLWAEGRKRGSWPIRDYIDIVALLHAKGQALDWDRLLAASDRYGLHEPLATILADTSVLLPSGRVPTEVLRRLRGSVTTTGQLRFGSPVTDRLRGLA